MKSFCKGKLLSGGLFGMIYKKLVKHVSFKYNHNFKAFLKNNKF